MEKTRSKKRKGVRGVIWNKAELAETLGVSLKTADDWIRKGMPVIKRGSTADAYEISSADAIEWVQMCGIARGLARKHGTTFQAEFDQLSRERDFWRGL